MQKSKESLISLQAEAKVLKERLEAIRRDYRSRLSQDSEERATELENADTLREIERVTVESLETINKKIAQLRLENQHN